ncbi:MAG: thiamine-phosphate kinase [Gemmatimonadota bacterium]|nr:thiamine-phosphate kinase [Gemmatimonadota bacterium]MDH4349949.1 thiamine-phosphate kinase [Gemmatimonadota bacterium]MDH5196877.1 thiamine-phosphate kinase [Gemmatimonadota bacterium]
MTAVLEHALIGRLAAALPRSPRQINRLHESDAELVSLPGSELILAVTTDALVEELATGLYDDPWHIGWMLVTVNASDLAAVGAEPLGLLLCESLPSDTSAEWIAALQRGIGDASLVTGLPVLGGDTNSAPTPHLAGTAIGLVSGLPPLTRCGCRAGDLLYASARLGTGGAFALTRLLPGIAGHGAFPFRPTARIAEGQLLRGRATCCMDTSDGAIATLDELMTRNDVGFLLDVPVPEWTNRRATAVAHAAGLPPWMLHAGPHGEFELLFTVPPDREADLVHTAATIGWDPVRIGMAVPEHTLSFHLDGAPRSIDARRIRNLFTECGGDARQYVAQLAQVVPAA